MAGTCPSYETDYTKFVIPVIQVNGKNVETDGITEGLRNKCSSLCHQVVTACDSGRTLEEGLQTYREHQQAKVDELQELMKDCSLMDYTGDPTRGSHNATSFQSVKIEPPEFNDNAQALNFNVGGGGSHMGPGPGPIGHQYC